VRSDVLKAVIINVTKFGMVNVLKNVLPPSSIVKVGGCKLREPHSNFKNFGNFCVFGVIAAS
jgi:hypothetical protein